MKKLNLLFCALICSLFVSGCSWFGGDDEEGEIKPAELVKFSQEATIKKQWSINIGASNKDFWNSLRPAASQELVFASDHEGSVTAIDIATGKRRWNIELDTSVSGGVGYGAGLVLLGTIEGHRTDGGGKLCCSRTAHPSFGGNTVYESFETRLARFVIAATLLPALLGGQ